jgi:hypothetical protein
MRVTHDHGIDSRGSDASLLERAHQLARAVAEQRVGAHARVEQHHALAEVGEFKAVEIRGLRLTHWHFRMGHTRQRQHRPGGSNSTEHHASRN